MGFGRMGHAWTLWCALLVAVILPLASAAAPAHQAAQATHPATTPAVYGSSPFPAQAVPSSPPVLPSVGQTTVLTNNTVYPGLYRSVDTVTGGYDNEGTTPAYDPNTNLFYEPVINETANATTGYNAGYLAAISPTTDRLVHLFPVGLEPEGVTYDSSNGLLYVLNYGSNDVSIVDPSTNATVGSLPYASGNALDGSMAVNNSSGQLYLGSVFGVYDLNVTTDAFVFVADTYQEDASVRVVYDNQTGEVYAVGDEVQVIGPNNGTVWKTIPFPNPAPSPGAGVPTVDWKTDELYVPWDNNTSAVELATNTLGPTLTLASVASVVLAAVFDPDNGMVYVVADYPSYNVTELNPATHQWVASGALPSAGYGGIAYSPESGRLLIAGAVQEYSSGLLLLTPSLQLVGEPVLAVHPAASYFDPWTGYLFAAELGVGNYGNASVIDPASGKVIGYVQAGVDPHAIWVDPNTGFGYIANFGPPPVGHVSNVTVFNARTFASTGSIPVGVEPYSMAYDPGTGYLYVANSGSDNITVINPATNSTVGGIDLAGFNPGVLVYDPLNSELYVTASVSGEDYGEMFTIAPESMSVVGEVETYYDPGAAAFDAATNLIYVQDTNLYTTTASYVIQEFDPVQGSFIGSIDLYHVTLFMAVDPYNGLLYVPDETNATNGGWDSYTLTEVNVTSGALVNLTLGQEPNGIAVNASSGEAFVTNTDAGSVMFIDPGTPAATSYTVTFETVPTSCSITFDGVTYTDGQQATGVAAGSYSLVAAACSGETFSSWSSTAGTVTSTTSNSTSVTVSATGTITATFTATAATYVVTFETSPTSCSITFDGVTYSNGEQASGVAAGSYSLSAPACTGETFSSWSSTAGTVTSTTSASTTVTVSATGTITATFTTTAATYVITFETSPTSCSVTFNGVSYTNDQQATGVAAGSYSLVAPACTGETFASWSSTAGTIASPDSASTTVTISATGTVTATFASTPPPTSYPVTFTETGLPTGTSWSVTFNSGLNSSTTATIGFSAVSGIYSFSVGTVAGYTAAPGSGQLTVNGGPASQEIKFTAISTPSPKSTTAGFLGLPGFEGYGLLGGLIALLVVIILLAVSRRHKLPVVFTESGLPGGTQWSVALDGSIRAAGEDVIMFTVGSGTHSYRVGAVGSFVPSPAVGSIEVKRDRVDVRIRFDPSRPKT